MRPNKGENDIWQKKPSFIRVNETSYDFEMLDFKFNGKF